MSVCSLRYRSKVVFGDFAFVWSKMKSGTVNFAFTFSFGKKVFEWGDSIVDDRFGVIRVGKRNYCYSHRIKMGLEVITCAIIIVAVSTMEYWLVFFKQVHTLVSIVDTFVIMIMKR